MIKNERNYCESIGIRQDDLIVIFDECSTNVFDDSSYAYCHRNAKMEQRLPKFPRAISVTGGQDDQFTISFNEEPSFDYMMRHACGVVYQRDIHFFGGYLSITGAGQYSDLQTEHDFRNQHFVIEKETSGTFGLRKRKDLSIGFENPSCSTVQIPGSSWYQNTIVILCFSLNQRKSCFSFDGELSTERPLLYKFRQG